MAKGQLQLILLAILPFIWSATAKMGPPHGKVVVCYISTWAVYRPHRGHYTIENFDGNLCTHAVYAFAGLNFSESIIKSIDPQQDLKEEYGKGGFERLTGLKRSYPHLKVTLAIGGWNEGSKNYSILAADPQRRRRFVKHVSGFVRRYNFDGLDLDWEYPTQREGAPHDRENFVKLTMELREEFDRYNLLLTSAIGAAKNVIDHAYDIRQISRYLDFLHIMCYDYHGSWDKIIGYNAPMTAPKNDPFSVEFTIDYLLKLGAPKEKLVLGLPFYGRTFNTPFEGELGDKCEGTALQGPYTREEGFLGYNEICNILSNKSSRWTTSWDGQTSQMIARSERDPFTGSVYAVTYDNARSIANKVRYAIRKNLAGVMIWSVDTDDFNGDCEMDMNPFADFEAADGSVGLNHQLYTNYPLLRTLNKAIQLAQDELRRPDEHADEDISNNEISHGIQSKSSDGSLLSSHLNMFSSLIILLTLKLSL